MSKRKRTKQREWVIGINSVRRCLAEDVVVRNLVQRDAVFEFRVGRASEYVDVMSRTLPFAGQIGRVDSLTAAKHVAAVGEQGDSHGGSDEALKKGGADREISKTRGEKQGVPLVHS